VKLTGLHRAAARGANTAWTGNLAGNAAMGAVNARLGYTDRARQVRVSRPTGTAPAGTA
jgi:hypothetical protein